MEHLRPAAKNAILFSRLLNELLQNKIRSVRSRDILREEDKMMGTRVFYRMRFICRGHSSREPPREHRHMYVEKKGTGVTECEANDPSSTRPPQ